MNKPARIWLCADDYGISPSVNGAIRDLIVQGRLNATSVIVISPSFEPREADALIALNAGSRRAAIGLHVTLTAPFRPLTKDFTRTYADAFLTVPPALVLALFRRYDPRQLAAEIAAQVDAFVAAFKRPPDFVDGHQHVQLFPQIRDAFLTVVKSKAPLAWVRQCGRSMPLAKRFADKKGLLLDVLSRGFRVRAAQFGVRTNPAFAGTYDFDAKVDFAALFPTFIDGLPENSVVMCHPGKVDDELNRIDELKSLREKEYAYFSGEKFPAALVAHGLTLV
jgi:chitin disaccharide deacetylase